MTDQNPNTASSLVTVGMFDGVHAGHRYLLQCLKKEARLRGLTPVVVTFTNHPLSVIKPVAAPAPMLPLQQKIDLIRSEGIDNVVAMEFDGELRKLTAAEFTGRILIPELKARALMLGYDNSFGSDCLKSAAQYFEALSSLPVEVLECKALDGCEVSSTLIRKALAAGNLPDAKRMLGRPYSIRGKVIEGRQLGRTIGFPTANIDVGSLLLPKPGVYAAKVLSASNPDIIGLPVMLNIGYAPTVNSGADVQPSVEAHIITGDNLCEPSYSYQEDKIDNSFNPSTLDEMNLNLYGDNIELEIIDRLRDEKRFATLEELRNALIDDRRATLRTVKSRFDNKC